VDRPIVSAEAQRQYDLVAAGLAGESGAILGKMMGMPMLYLAGKGFAGLYGDAMVFKLEGEAHAVALALPTAALFDPSGMGRPMKAWVQVPVAHASAWPRLARSAAQSIANAT
jgi:hypothetical protein